MLISIGLLLRVPVVEAALQPEAEVYKVKSYESAAEYLIERAVNCEPEIWMQIDEGALSKEEIDKLFFMLPKYRLAELRVMVTGNMYKLEPAYKSCVRMLSYSRGNTAVTLSPEEKRALQVAENTLREVGAQEKTAAETARALHDWIVLHSVYDLENADFNRKYDKGYNPFDGKYLLLEHKGVCDAYVQAYWLMLQMAGVPCSMMSGHILKDGQGHAWNLVYLGDHWAHVDTTFDDPVPDREGVVQYDHYDKTDEEMAKNRRWERDVFPNAAGEGALMRKVVRLGSTEQLQAYLRREKRGVFAVEVAGVRPGAAGVAEVLHAAKTALPAAAVSAVNDPFYPRAVRLRVE